jgi:hypothetical protein
MYANGCYYQAMKAHFWLVFIFDRQEQRSMTNCNMTTINLTN